MYSDSCLIQMMSFIFLFVAYYFFKYTTAYNHMLFIYIRARPTHFHFLIAVRVVKLRLLFGGLPGGIMIINNTVLQFKTIKERCSRKRKIFKAL